MEVHNIDLKILIWGSIFDCQVTIEGYTVGLWNKGRTDAGQLYLHRTLPEFPTDHDINFVLIARGINGASVELQITVDQHNIKNIPCVITNGMGTIFYNIKTLITP